MVSIFCFLLKKSFQPCKYFVTKRKKYKSKQNIIKVKIDKEKKKNDVTLVGKILFTVYRSYRKHVCLSLFLN